MGLHTADTCSLHNIFADCADWRLPDLGENYENCFEPGPYGSVWADNCAESLPLALGSLWDASRTPKPSQKSKNHRFSGFRGSGGVGPLFPLLALKGCGQKFNNPMQRLLGPLLLAASRDLHQLQESFGVLERVACKVFRGFFFFQGRCGALSHSRRYCHTALANKAVKEFPA